jgi:hypothetical protein
VRTPVERAAGSHTNDSDDERGDADDSSTSTGGGEGDFEARLEQALHAHFTTPRLLALGDLLVLLLAPTPTVPRRWGDDRPRASETVHLEVQPALHLLRAPHIVVPGALYSLRGGAAAPLSPPGGAACSPPAACLSAPALVSTRAGDGAVEPRRHQCARVAGPHPTGASRLRFRHASPRIAPVRALHGQHRGGLHSRLRGGSRYDVELSGGGSHSDAVRACCRRCAAGARVTASPRPIGCGSSSPPC